MHAHVRTGADGLEIRWADGSSDLFPFIWLRDNDPAGFHPQTGERTFDLGAVAIEATPSDAGIEGDALILRWPDQHAPSRLDLGWLRAHRPGRRRPDPAAIAPVCWRADAAAAGLPRAAAAELAASDAGFLDWLERTKRYGLSIVHGLAQDPEAGMALARRIGHLRETNFGVTFEVVSKPDPNNLAYTADALPLHTDLTNQELPPGYQFLHCIANDAAGGGSVFCDGFALAQDLRTRDPAAFELLTRVALPYRFHDATTDIRGRRTVIRLGETGEFAEIAFNAHIADIVDLPAAEATPFYRAYQLFMAMSREPRFALTLRLQAGEMAVFDNRRVLHGREAFDPASGRRHLRGAYVDHGEWDSRIRVLARAPG